MTSTSIKEGLSAIAAEVLDDVRKEAEAFIASAEADAKVTLQSAREEAEKAYVSIKVQAENKAQSEKRKLQSLTDVEIRNLGLLQEEKLVEAAFEKALAKLKEFVKSEVYHDCLLNFIERGAQKIGSNNLLVRVNKEDKTWLEGKILKDLSSKLHLNLALSEDSISCVGGCRIETIDQKIIYDNTFENRLLQLKPLLRLEVAQILFEKEDSWK